MKTYMFPGQGSQAKGMGGSLFDEFKELTASADDQLGYSIKELCLHDPGNELNQTQFTQPALYVVNHLSYLKYVDQSGEKPGFLLGHSLGEFNALTAAECFDFEAGLKLVRKRSELMSRATGGAMAAVLNLRAKEIETALAENGLENVDLANYNTPFQTVISGSRTDLASAQAVVEKLGARFFPLNTSGAFHSRFMQPAKEKFRNYLRKFRLSSLKIPVISNVTARPYDADDIVDTLSGQITSSVRWSDSIMYLLSLETDADEPMEFRELGHGAVLTGLLEKIRKEAALLNENDRDGTETGSETTASEQSKEADGEVNGQVNGQALQGMAHAAGDKGEEPDAFADAERKVRLWNQNQPVGTKVRSLTMDYDELETRTEAVVLFGHRAAVYMKGYNGYFDLDEIEPL